jgi:acid phosphatase family membrane protein YuiD
MPSTRLALVTSCAAAVAAKPAFNSRDAALAKKEEEKKATQAEKQST